MKFLNTDKTLTPEEVQSLSQAVGLSFPKPLEELFLNHNGGEPDPYIFKSFVLETVVAETLPLASGAGRGTALDSYQHLVQNQKLVPKHFFPFAVDAGGDYFFCDTTSEQGDVYFFKSEYFPNLEKCLVNLNLGMDAFFNGLVADDELT